MPRYLNPNKTDNFIASNDGKHTTLKLNTFI